MKLIVGTALFISIATSLGVKLAGSTGAGSFIYLSSCDNADTINVVVVVAPYGWCKSHVN